MKQVTMESIQNRIADLESAAKVVGGLSLSSEFELACLRELAAVTEQRDAVVVENVALKSKGRELLNEACKVYQEFNEICVDGDFMDGQTLHEFQFVLDVETPTTAAAIAALRAEVRSNFVDDAVAAISESGALTVGDCIVAVCQLRESKGANHE